MDDLIPAPEESKSLKDKVNELKVLQILTLMVNDHKTVKEACDSVGVPVSTYNHWQKTGVTLAAYTEVANRITELTFEVLLPGYKQMVETLAAVAQGQAPDHAPRMKVDANHAIAAWREIKQILPTKPIDQAGAGMNASDHLRDYRPKQINPIPDGQVTTFNQINNFLYKVPDSEEPRQAPEDYIDLTPDKS